MKNHGMKETNRINKCSGMMVRKAHFHVIYTREQNGNPKSEMHRYIKNPRSLN